MERIRNENKRNGVLIICLMILFSILIWNKHGNRTESDNGKQLNIQAE